MTMGPVHIPFIFLAASFVGLVILVPLGYIRGKRRDLLAIHEAMPLPSKATDGFYADDISANPPSKVLGVLAQTALALPLALFLGAAVAMPFWVVYEVVPVWAGIDLRRVPTLVFWVASFASFLIILSLAYARGKRIEAGKQQPSQRDQELKSV